MALGERRSRESPWSFPRQTNKQTDKQKILSTERSEFSTLAFIAQCSYRLSYSAVLIWLVLSDYYYQITIIRLTKNFGHTEVRTLDPRVLQCSYRLSYRPVLIWLLLSDYCYQITIILHLIEILIHLGSPDNCYQDPTGYPGL